jgi:tellurite resistance protein TerC
MDVSPWMWVTTLGFVVLLIALDLLVHRKPQETSLKEAAWTTAIWTVLGLAFTGIILAEGGGEAAGQYFAGYLLERTLSIDNVFVFVIILSYFAVPARLEHRALLFGVIAALVLRAVFIFVGAAALEHLAWMTYIFGAILLLTAYKLLRSGDEEVDPAKNIALRALRKIVPVSHDYHEHSLFIRKAGKRVATPLLAVLLVLGTTDVVFAVDSIPAIFGITREPYLVFTSNAFALLGLRSMSVLLARVMDRFAYLQHSLAIVLAFVGAEMMLEHYYELNIWTSLSVIATILGIGIAASFVATRKTAPAEPIASADTSRSIEQ